MQSEDVRSGLRAIRFWRAVLILAVAAFILLITLVRGVSGASMAAFAFLALTLAVSWISYLGSVCPACGQQFFIPSDSPVPRALRLRWAGSPWRLSCANCGLSLRRHP
jgi:hypothetical protein